MLFFCIFCFYLFFCILYFFNLFLYFCVFHLFLYFVVFDIFLYFLFLIELYKLYNAGCRTALPLIICSLDLNLPASCSGCSLVFFPTTVLVTISQKFPISHTHSLSKVSFGNLRRSKSSLEMPTAPTVEGRSLRSLERSQIQALATWLQEVKRCSLSCTIPRHS